MKLTPFLEDSKIYVNLRASDKEAVFGRLVKGLNEKGVSIDVGAAVSELMKCEGRSSTGVGKGLAIPHATVKGLPSTRMAIATLADSIDFRSIDRKPVNLVVLLLSPPGFESEHLALLARITRICSDEMFVGLMMQARDSEELLQLLLEEDERRVG